MLNGHSFTRRLLAIILALTFAPCARARQQPVGVQKSSPVAPQELKKTPAQDEEVLQVTTELVQIAATVFDAKGRFVEDLRPEQFELKVDGRAVAVSFFERVAAGTPRDRGRIAPPAGGGRANVSAPAEPVSDDAGRTIYFFVDDQHMTPQSLARVRQAILIFVENSMGERDEVAVASPTGQIGFLQQLTDDKTVLRAAISRLASVRGIVADAERPPIRIEEAHAVVEQNNRSVLDYLVNETIKDSPASMTRALAETLVLSRVNDVLRAAAQLNRTTLLTLLSLLRASSGRGGRKIVFFVSEGFMLQSANADDRDMMQRVTDAAARADAVLYALDARGLATNPDFQAARAGGFDAGGLLANASPGAEGLARSQEPLRQLAADTGGRALLNSNALDKSVAAALEETSRYYLLAWKPEGAGAGAGAGGGGRFRKIELKITGRPDLTVRVHKGFLAPRAASSVAKAGAASPPAKTSTPQDEMRAAVSAAYARAELPVFAAAHYAESAGAGAMVNVSVGVSSDALSFKAAEGGRAAGALDLACFILDDAGRQVQNYFSRLDVSARSSVVEGGAPVRDVAQDFSFKDLKPGLYQVRAAARDSVSGRVGSATQWIEVPDLSRGQLALSSPVIGVAAAAGSAIAPATLSAGRPLARGSRLYYSLFVYNAARGAGGALPPGVAVRAMVLSSGRAVAEGGEREVPTDGIEDFSRLPFADELSLAVLPSGRYTLQVTATDRVAGKSATRLAKFTIR
ncbi:MAG: VWA domain-containing protein [Acidobacteria bacterium]|nr:VWA domain-containing protein [Acidobacteriota bacterium]